MKFNAVRRRGRTHAQSAWFVTKSESNFPTAPASGYVYIKLIDRSLTRVSHDQCMGGVKGFLFTKPHPSCVQATAANYTPDRGGL